MRLLLADNVPATHLVEAITRNCDSILQTAAKEPLFTKILWFLTLPSG